jgi:hypothetical protein
MTDTPDPSILYIENNGPEIQASNFWDSDLGQSGGLYISVNEGYIRLWCRIATASISTTCALEPSTWSYPSCRETCGHPESSASSSWSKTAVKRLGAASSPRVR